MSDPEYIIPFDRLPDRIADAVYRPPAVPVVPRPAATIVLLRDVDDGIEVLLVRRSRASGFVPGAYVFPGGMVDRADAAPEAIEGLEGLTPDAAARRLALVGADPPAIAYYLAALREAFEETGILVGVGPDGEPPPTAAEDGEVDALRIDLLQDRITFAHVVRRMRSRLAGTAIEYVAHWVTPEPEPRRYDTRFFAAKVHGRTTPIVDGREMTDAVWLPPRRALERTEEGSMPMIFPTIKTLQRLASFGSTTDALVTMGGARVRTLMPTLVITPTGVGMKLDGDE
jgi:8-oxo-dGTP pyrophosphatase MutT (NUDIX family)